MNSAPDRLQLACDEVRRIATMFLPVHHALASDTLTAVDSVEKGLSAASVDEREAAARLLADVAQRAWETAVQVLRPIPGIH